VLEKTSRLADDGTEIEHDRLQMGHDPRKAGGLDGTE